jgi:hypothetical protein
MAFALSVVHIKEALKKTGCPICRLEYETAVHSIESYLWEQVNDPIIRKKINDALGFCIEHTRMLVSAELTNTGSPLGVNIIYALLAKIAKEDLESYQKRRKIQKIFSPVKKLFRKLTRLVPSQFHLFEKKSPCLICHLADESGKDMLTDLMEVLEAGDVEMKKHYQESDGLCMKHVKAGLQLYHERFPEAAQIIMDDTIKRLSTQRTAMLEFIRKNDWSYRDEQITHEESIALTQTLTFFTGLSSKKFTFKNDPF